MPATVEIDGQRATVINGTWHCADELMQYTLQAFVRPPWGYHPDPDYSHAMVAVEKLGGRIIQHDPPAADPHAVY